ncbi:membrane dipeptidase [Klebsiella pneumoniae]|nr:membrane dipeptidase [Klebsiella pneumoniae]
MNEKVALGYRPSLNVTVGGHPPNAHALCPQPRNLTDQQLRAIRATAAAVGVNFGNAFLRADGRRDSDTPQPPLSGISGLSY